MFGACLVEGMSHVMPSHAYAADQPTDLLFAHEAGSPTELKLPSGSISVLQPIYNNNEIHWLNVNKHKPEPDCSLSD